MLQPISTTTPLALSNEDILFHLMQKVRKCYPKATLFYHRKQETGIHHIEVSLTNQEHEIVELSNFSIALKFMRLALKERIKRYKEDALTTHTARSSSSCFDCPHIFNDSYANCANCKLKLPQ